MTLIIAALIVLLLAAAVAAIGVLAILVQLSRLQ